MKQKRVEQVLMSMPTSDGAGVNLRRAIGRAGLRNVDPFLMLDEIRSDDPKDYIAGFPPHPHKGFETLSYMLKGSMAHKDSTGGEGLITSGGVQYMTAGKGIIHSETPKQESGMLWGFQLWINLPAKDKFQDAKYVDIPKDQIPELDLTEHTKAKLIAGKFHQAVGPVKRDDIGFFMADVTSRETDHQNFEFDNDTRGFVYVYKGHADVNGQQVPAQSIAQLGAGERVEIASQKDTGYLLLAATPIEEPIVQYGPFVMNTQAEIDQAVSDYQNGRFA